LVEDLLSSAELADDLNSFGEDCSYGAVALAFDGASPSQVWPVRKLT
jgi:hypothetical protein